MKNLAARMLALIMVLSALLMPISALAAERQAGVLTVGNLELYIGEESISLPVYLQIGGGADLENESGYGFVNVLTSEKTALSAMAAVENGELKGYLNGMEYGIVMPLEQVVAALESAAGVSLSDLTGEAASAMSPELQAAAARMAAAYTALMADGEAMQTTDLDAYWQDVLGATVEAGTEAETVTLFDVETQAVPMTATLPEMTYTELFEKISAMSPAAKEFYDAYFEFFNLLLAETAEQGDEEMKIEDLLNMVSMSMSGTLYPAEEGTYAEITVTVTVTEGEESTSMEIPYALTTLTDANGTYAAVVVQMEVDGEMLYMTVYADDYSEEGMDYTNMEISASISDVDAEAADMGMVFSLYTAGNEVEGTAYGIDLYVEESGVPMNIGGYYYAYPAEYSEAEDSYSGYVNFYMMDSTMSIDAYLDTNLTLTAMPTGELLTFATSMNPLEADEAALEQLGTDAMNVVTQGLMVLMSDPEISAVISNLSGATDVPATAE